MADLSNTQFLKRHQQLEFNKKFFEYVQCSAFNNNCDITDHRLYLHSNKIKIKKCKHFVSVAEEKYSEQLE